MKRNGNWKLVSEKKGKLKKTCGNCIHYTGLCNAMDFDFDEEPPKGFYYQIKPSAPAEEMCDGAFWELKKKEAKA